MANKKSGLHLTLVIPGLFGSPAFRRAAVPEVPELTRFLARAEVSANPAQTLEAVLFGCFNHPFPSGPSGDDLPVAAVTRVADMGETVAGGWWLRADPVHLRADRDSLVMLGGRTLAITPEEMEEFAQALRTVFAPSGGEFSAPNGLRWYLHLPGDPLIRTHDVAETLGRAILPFLPDGPRSRHWRALLNEAQMSLHACPANAAREARGARTVNSVWLWGGGPLPPPRPAPWARVWSNEPLARGLSGLANVPCDTIPAGLAEWLEAAESPGHHLVVLDGLREEVAWHDLASWHASLQAVSAQWFAPLPAALKTGEVAEVNLQTCVGPVFRLTRGGLKRWWRRRRKLMEYAPR